MAQRMRLVAGQQASGPVQAIVLVVAHKTPVARLVARDEHNRLSRPVAEKKLAVADKHLVFAGEGEKGALAPVARLF